MAREITASTASLHLIRAVSYTHLDVGAAVGFAHDQGDLGIRGLGIGEEELGAVADDAAAFLVLAGQEAGHVHQVDVYKRQGQDNGQPRSWRCQGGSHGGQALPQQGGEEEQDALQLSLIHI